MIVVPAERAGVVCRVRAEARHMCPFFEEVDRGELEVTWATTDVTVEMHSLVRFLASFADVVTSHEDLVAAVSVALEGSGVEPRSVRWIGSTAGMNVTVEVSSAVLRESVDRADS